MSEALLTLLRWCLLALIYLFFFRVLQATWISTVAGRRTDGRRAGGTRTAVAAGSMADRPGSTGTTKDASVSERKRRGGRRRSGVGGGPNPPTLVIVEPADASGQRFDVSATLSIGRAAGCEITLDDTFVSQVHARIAMTPNGVVVEDLGSTNGTYLNRKRVTAPVVMQPGDVVQVGSTVLELQ